LVHWPLMGGLLHLVQRGGDYKINMDGWMDAGLQPINGQYTSHRIVVLCSAALIC